MTDRLQASNTNEKLLAALSQATIVIPGLGIIAPLIIWIVQRDKSAYLAFQALQGMTYQLFFMPFYWIVSLISSIAFFFIFIPASAFMANVMSNGGVPFMLIGLELLFFCFIFGIAGLYVLGGLIAAVLCLTGPAFRYPFFGARLEKYLTHTPAQTPVEVPNA